MFTRFRRAFPGLLAAALACPVFPASVSANVIGPGTQNFNTTPTGLDFVTVQSSETLDPGIAHVGYFVNYSRNSLPSFDSPGAPRTDFSSSLLGMDLNFGFGLLKNWDIGVSFPSVIYESVQATGTAYGSFAKLGLTEVRPTTKYRLWGDDSRGIALIGSANFNVTTNDPYKGIGAGPGYNLEIAGDKTFGKWAVALNLGYRWTQSGTRVPGAPVEPLRNLWIGSVATSYLFPRYDTKLIFEIFGSLPDSSTGGNQGRQASSIEALVGGKHDFTTHFSGHFGLGTALVQGISSPDFRTYAGLNYEFGPVFERPLLWELTYSKGRSFVSNRILFEFDSDQMIGDFALVLDKFNDYLVDIKQYKRIVIEGHTDSVGNDDYNETLSIRRAEAVRRYLIKEHRVPADKIAAEGYGEKRPIADNGNFQGRQFNRRVEFKIFL